MKKETKETHPVEKKCKKLSTFPFVLVTLGIIILIENLGIMQDGLRILWPIILIVVGVVKLYNSRCND